MRQQYGLRVQGEEFQTMDWDEFSDLVAGLNEQTPLVRIAQIRTESDPEALKDFTKDQREIRSEWQRKKALRKPREDTMAFVSQMQTALARMCQGGDQ